MNDKFYKDGLKFQCQQCSKCCRHDPGYVFLSEYDLKKILKKYSFEREDFINKFCTVVNMNGFKRLSLIEKPNFDCIFWENGGCKIYEVRPFQCVSYPFWSPHLFSIETWDALEKDCPGINKGPLHSQKEIDKWLKQREKEMFIIINDENTNKE